MVPSGKRIYLPEIDWSAFFNTCQSPDMIRGINLGFVHLADMSKWKDPTGRLTSRTIAAAVSAVLREYFTLVVYEGNIPKEDQFPYKRMLYLDIPFNEKMAMFRHLSKNPYLLNHVIHVATFPGDCGFLHINLDDMHSPNYQIFVPYSPSRIPSEVPSKQGPLCVSTPSATFA